MEWNFRLQNSFTDDDKLGHCPYFGGISGSGNLIEMHIKLMINKF